MAVSWSVPSLVLPNQDRRDKTRRLHPSTQFIRMRCGRRERPSALAGQSPTWGDTGSREARGRCEAAQGWKLGETTGGTPCQTTSSERSFRSLTVRPRGWSPTTPRTLRPASRRSSRCGPPPGRPMCWWCCSTTSGSGRERVRRPVLDADCRATCDDRPEVQPVPHHRAVLADPSGAVVGPQPPHGGDGWRHRDRHLGTWV